MDGYDNNTFAVRDAGGRADALLYRVIGSRFSTRGAVIKATPGRDAQRRRLDGTGVFIFSVNADGDVSSQRNTNYRYKYVVVAEGPTRATAKTFLSGPTGPS